MEARARFSEMTSGNKVSTMVEDVNPLQHSPKFSLLCRLGVLQGYGAQQIIKGGLAKLASVCEEATEFSNRWRKARKKAWSRGALAFVSLCP